MTINSGSRRDPDHPAQDHRARLQRGGRLRAVVTAIGVSVALFAALMTTASASTSGLDPAFGTSADLWIERDVLRSLPTTGEAWEDLAEDATEGWDQPDIADNSSDHDVQTFAGALYAVRMNDTGMRNRVVDAIEGAIGTENGDNALSIARNLTGYVLAADLVGYRSNRFTSWLDAVRTEDLDGRTLISTHEDRPNNWGTHAGAARIAAGLYLGDTADVARARQVFLGYLGDRSAYSGFKYGDLAWQANPSQPVGINPKGATRNGVNVDGILPDDQRRCECPVTDPPTKENYVWEALQGVLAQATLLSNQGHREVWTASDSAIRRAVSALYDRAHYPAEGDDTFLTYLIDAGLGTTYSHGVEARHGKSLGYADWTHAPGVPTPSAAKSPEVTSPPITTAVPGPSPTDGPETAPIPAPGTDGVTPGSELFGDVERGSYYDHPVGWLASRDITNGVRPDRYVPSGHVPRSQMAAFMWRLGGQDETSGRLFADVDADAYYAPAAAWLRTTGITTGVTGDRYFPDARVTRAQVVAFLYRFAGTPDVDDDVEHFADVTRSAYYSDATRWARDHGITTGTSASSFDPDARVTRAQLAALLWRLADNRDALDDDAQSMVR